MSEKVFRKKRVPFFHALLKSPKYQRRGVEGTGGRDTLK